MGDSVREVIPKQMLPMVKQFTDGIEQYKFCKHCKCSAEFLLVRVCQRKFQDPVSGAVRYVRVKEQGPDDKIELFHQCPKCKNILQTGYQKQLSSVLTEKLRSLWKEDDE